MSMKKEHPVWSILQKDNYVPEFYPKVEEMYDFIQSLINITGNITENGETIPTMLKFFNMWNDYSSETFHILDHLVNDTEDAKEEPLNHMTCFGGDDMAAVPIEGEH